MHTFIPTPCKCMKGDLRRFHNGLCLVCDGTGIKDLLREKTLKHNLEARQPTLDEYRAFKGAHCSNIYKRLAESWRCPGCQRTKFQILRWTMLYPKKKNAHMGWAGGYHTHHDHSSDRHGLSQAPICTLPRFEPTVVCEQCNSADSSAKKKLALPSAFSFSPSEIRQFVIGYPHGKHFIYYDKAQSIYNSNSTRTGIFW